MGKKPKKVFAREPAAAERPVPQAAAGPTPATLIKPSPVGPAPAGDFVLCPRDGLFLKDGREWGPAGAGWAHSLDWPAPSTLLGALRTATGREAETRGKPWGKQQWQDLAAVTSLGATLALRRPLAPLGQGGWNKAHRVWLVPADALFLNDETGKKHREVLRLDPTPATPSLGADDDPAREALWRPLVEDRGKPARAPAWWSEETWTKWLAEPEAERPWKDPPEDDPLSGFALPRHVQVHVGIDRDTGAAKDEILFAHDVVEMLDDKRHEWAIGCQFASTRIGDRPGLRATLGGDRRLALIETAAGLFDIPAALAKAFKDQPPAGIRLVAVTPAAFSEGWCLPGFAPAGTKYLGRLPEIDGELILRACMVSRAGNVSGWDMAKGDNGAPKPTTRLVPPGSVYHLAKVSEAPFTDDEAKKLWLIALGERTLEGFGRFVPGLWTPKENG